jgi:hypothetical protein
MYIRYGNFWQKSTERITAMYSIEPRDYEPFSRFCFPRNKSSPAANDEGLPSFLSVRLLYGPQQSRLLIVMDMRTRTSVTRIVFVKRPKCYTIQPALSPTH